MSMCLYITSGPQGRMLELMRDQDAMAALTTGSIVGRMKSMGAFQGGAPAEAFAGMEVDDDEVEKQLKEMGREAWRQGVFPGIYMHLVKGQLREDLKQTRTLLQSFHSQLNGTIAAEADGDGGSYIDLHKSWHVLHYLFTGTSWGGLAPASTLLKGGRQVGEDLGYGRARVVDAAATRAFAGFLGGLSADDLKARIDMKKMARLEIYCAEDDDDMAREELLEDVDHFFPMLKDYVGAAASRRESLAIWMT